MLAFKYALLDHDGPDGRQILFRQRRVHGIADWRCTGRPGSSAERSLSVCYHRGRGSPRPRGRGAFGIQSNHPIINRTIRVPIEQSNDPMTR
jgi:hypothetical protein